MSARIAIIGSGPTGIYTLSGLVGAERPLVITIFEIEAEAGKGTPYHPDINDQAMLVNEYQSAWNSFRQDKHFNPDEAGYMLTVYNNLIGASLKNLSDLSMIVTDSQLRMSDAERLAAIDRIFTDSHGQLSFLRSFNDRNYRIAVQRAREANDPQTIKKLYGIN